MATRALPDAQASALDAFAEVANERGWAVANRRAAHVSNGLRQLLGTLIKRASVVEADRVAKPRARAGPPRAVGSDLALDARVGVAAHQWRHALAGLGAGLSRELARREVAGLRGEVLEVVSIRFRV